MADVQLENGYCRIANAILENIALLKLNGSQYKIILTIWRQTYGFNRKDHEMSAGFIAKATGIDPRNVRKELVKLNSMKIIHQKISSGEKRVIGFNKDFEQWEGVSTLGRIDPRAYRPEGQCAQGGEGENALGDRVDSPSKEIHSFKDNSINKSTTTAVDLTHEDILERSYEIERYFCQKRGRGFNVTVDDFTSIQLVVAHPVPVEFIKSIIDKAFVEYVPKHGFDRITNFKFIAPRCMDEYVKATSKVTPIRIGHDAQWQPKKRTNQKPVLPIVTNAAEPTMLSPEQEAELEVIKSKLRQKGQAL